MIFFRMLFCWVKSRVRLNRPSWIDSKKFCQFEMKKWMSGHSKPHLTRSIMLASKTALRLRIHGTRLRCPSFHSKVTVSSSLIIDSSFERRSRRRVDGVSSVRSFARSSAPTDESPADKAVTFIITVGYEAEVAKGVVKALQESGLSGEALLATARQLAGRWEVGEDEGLEALAASVKMTLQRTEGKEMVSLKIVPPNSWHSAEGEEGMEDDYDTMMTRAFPVQAFEGTSLTDVAKFGTGEGASTLGEYIECACSGIMACSTCHVVLDDKWFEKVGPPGEAEQDMLDLAYSPRDTSRLGCQIVLTKELDGMVVKLPKGANNLMDFVPFED